MTNAITPHTIADALRAVHDQDPKRLYSVAEVKEIVYPLTQALEAEEADRVYVDVIDLSTDKRLTVTDSFDGAANWAWGYLRGTGSEINDGREILVHHTGSGRYQIVASGCIKTSGDDWDRELLEKDLKAADTAAKAAQKALVAHKEARARRAAEKPLKEQQ